MNARCCQKVTARTEMTSSIPFRKSIAQASLEALSLLARRVTRQILRP